MTAKRHQTLKLVDLIVDSMADGNLELPDIAEQLYQELKSRAKDARSNPIDYTDEEQTFWRQADRDAERLRGVNWPHPVAA
jgi:hypothetical protein